MPHPFNGLTAKIHNNQLIIKDIIDTVLSVHVALYNKLPPSQQFRNVAIQGYAAWLILYDYLSSKRSFLPKHIIQFLDDDITNTLMEVSTALNKDFNAVVSSKIKNLYEKEIKQRSPDGFVINYYTEEELNTICQDLINKDLMASSLEFNTTGHIVYRERDGRFFVILDRGEVIHSITQYLNLEPNQAEINSAHVTLTEGQNCKEIFDTHFKDKIQALPCPVKSKDALIYFGERVKIKLKNIYGGELCKNPPISYVHVVELESDDIDDFKKRFNFPGSTIRLHSTIGVQARKPSWEIVNSGKTSVLEFLDNNNPYSEALVRNIEMYYKMHNDNSPMGPLLFQPQEEKRVEASLHPMRSNRNIKEELVLATIRKKSEFIKEIYALGFLTKELGEQALLIAASYNALEMMQTLLEYDVSPDAFLDHETALGMAAIRGHTQIAELLLKKGATVDQCTSTEYEPDCTPLRQALMHPGDRPANPNLILLLLRHGADIKKINQSGKMNLAIRGSPKELAILFQHGFDPNTLIEGKPLLNLCFQHKKFELALVFIQHGADVHYIDEKGKSYLHKSHNLELTQLLVSKGLNLEALDHQGKTPIECMHALCVPVAEFLASQGASIMKLSIHNPVVLASAMLTKCLMNEGLVDMNSPDTKGLSPLSKLMRGVYIPGYLETLSLLLDSNLPLDINQQDQKGCTALHYAFHTSQNHGEHSDLKEKNQHLKQNLSIKAIDLLIAKGAVPLQDKIGRTPLMYFRINSSSISFGEHLMNRYVPFEAVYYGIESDLYKKELGKGQRATSQFFGLFNTSSVRSLLTSNSSCRP